MKLRHIAAAACLAAMGSAHALSPADIDAARTAGTLKEIRLAGASALRLSIGAYIQEICTPASFDVYFNDAVGANHRGYSCNLAATVGSYAAGTPILVTKRDQGGSTQGVAPIANNAAQALMQVSAASCGASVGASPSADIQAPGWYCNLTDTVPADAGISDVEPSLLQQAINRPDGAGAVAITGLNTGPLVQGIFAVAANTKLYFALQRAQFPAETAGKTIADIDTLPQPSLTSQYVRSVLTNQITGSVGGNKGWNVVVPASVDPLVSGKTVNICRRAEGSGTQAASNAFFANNPCNTAPGVGGAFTPLGVSGSAGGVAGTLSVRTGATAVSESTGTGGVETCFTTVNNATTATVGDDAYAIGVLGRENNPTPSVGAPKNYRYVKLDGVAPTRNEAKVGNYPFFMESTMQWNAAALAGDVPKTTFLSAVRTNAGKSAALAKADVDTQQGVMAAPTTYTGSFLALSNVDELNFASRVSRGGNSCAPVRIVK